MVAVYAWRHISPTKPKLVHMANNLDHPTDCECEACEQYFMSVLYDREMEWTREMEANRCIQ